MQRISVMILACFLLPACAVIDDDSGTARSPPWKGEVEAFGEMRAMFHEGRTETMVAMDTMLPDPGLYALGALADLAGEITVIGGRAHLAFPEGKEDSRTEVVSSTRAGACLLVTAQVQEWHSVTTRHPIRFEELDEAVGSLAAEAGLDADDRFPFLMEGQFEDLQWHVIDGSRLDGTETSCEEHRAASFQAQRDQATAVLLGFYSTGDQGVFTKRGSRTHIHCVLHDPLASGHSGHVDHVDIPAGTIVKFPAPMPE